VLHSFRKTLHQLYHVCRRKAFPIVAGNADKQAVDRRKQHAHHKKFLLRGIGLAPVVHAEWKARLEHMIYEIVLQNKWMSPDLIILDMSMPRMNGVDAARELKHICPNVPVILYTAFADVFRRKQVLPEGVSDVVAKGENLLDRVVRSLGKTQGGLS
jgi:CheY-like chemotaxis protein